MSTQYTDNSWSELESLPLALKTFSEALEKGNAKRFIVGSKNEVEAEQEKIEVEQAVSKINDRLDAIEARQDQSLVKIPTQREIIEYTLNENP